MTKHESASSTDMNMDADDSDDDGDDDGDDAVAVMAGSGIRNISPVEEENLFQGHTQKFQGHRYWIPA